MKKLGINNKKLKKKKNNKYYLYNNIKYNFELFKMSFEIVFNSMLHLLLSLDNDDSILIAHINGSRSNYVKFSIDEVIKLKHAKGLFSPVLYQTYKRKFFADHDVKEKATEGIVAVQAAESSDPVVESIADVSESVVETIRLINELQEQEQKEKKEKETMQINSIEILFPRKLTRFLIILKKFIELTSNISIVDLMCLFIEQEHDNEEYIYTQLYKILKGILKITFKFHKMALFLNLIINYIQLEKMSFFRNEKCIGDYNKNISKLKEALTTEPLLDMSGYAAKLEEYKQKRISIDDEIEQIQEILNPSKVSLGATEHKQCDDFDFETSRSIKVKFPRSIQWTSSDSDSDSETDIHLESK